MTKKILVTGSEGFIGSHIIQLLVRKGYSVKAHVLYNSFNSYGWLDSLPETAKKDFEIVMGDIRNLDSVKNSIKNCDRVINLAALVAIPYSYISPDSYVETNIKGTLNLLQAAKEHKITKFIHTSTSEVYGTAQFVPINEMHPLNGQSPYAASKIGADQMALAYHKSFETPVSIIRPFNAYGPRQSARAVIPTIISQLANNKKNIKLGSLTPTRDFTYVTDIANAFLAALKSKSNNGQVINLGGGIEISVGDLAKKIAKLMKKEVNIITDKKRLRPKLSEVERLKSDYSKAKKLLKWKPKYEGKKGFDMGMQKTIEWYLDKENLNKYKSDTYNV